MKANRIFHVMSKPIGPICNIDCQYCYYLEKEKLYPKANSFRMKENILEKYIKQYINSQHSNEINFAWQGGEPLLLGIDFFKRVIELQKKYSKPGTLIQNTIQTNSIIINKQWAKFFKQHNFLVGVSLDGPADLHDHYRVDKKGGPTHTQVLRGLQFLKKFKVDFNILCTVNEYNCKHPIKVYNYFKSIGAEFIQFIPIVEYSDNSKKVSSRSVVPKKYGDFLISIFDEWVTKDIGKIFVQIFDIALEAWLGLIPSLCIFRDTCGDAMAMEHNGDLYSCDHFVTPKYLLGNIEETPLLEMVNSDFQKKFGETKRESLPKYCLDCEVKFVCNGGCPKDRFIETPNGEKGLNYLCEGYRNFFNHIDEPMKLMASALKNRMPASEIMPIMKEKMKDKY